MVDEPLETRAETGEAKVIDLDFGRFSLDLGRFGPLVWPIPPVALVETLHKVQDKSMLVAPGRVGRHASGTTQEHQARQYNQTSMENSEPLEQGSGRRPRKARDQRTRLRDRVPARRERFTPVKRLRRRAGPSARPLTFGQYGFVRGEAYSGADPDNDDLGTDSDTFRLVCWNIEDGIDIDGTTKGLTEHPNLQYADAICLQEMDPTGVDQIGYELELNYVYFESSKDGRTGRGFGNAIMSPWPLIDCVVAPLPHTAKAYGRPRAAVGAVVDKPGFRTSAWSIHTEIPPLSLSRRVAQFTAAAAKAIAPNPDHLLLAGDFNTTTGTAVEAIDELYNMFELERLSEAAGPSLRRAGRLFRLDHIFGRGVTALASGVERDVIASDHWPLWVLVESAIQPESDSENESGSAP